MLSKKAEYGLRALIQLATARPGEPMLIADIAAREGIPKKFLEGILLGLKRRGFLESKKGKGGGYQLAKPANAICMGDAIRALEGPLAPVPCVSKTAYVKCRECPDEMACGLRLVMKDVRDAIAGILDTTSLANAVGRMRRAKPQGEAAGSHPPSAKESANVIRVRKPGRRRTRSAP
jgi:Rrf2 family protein